MKVSSTDFRSTLPLLYRRDWTARGFADEIARIEVTALRDEYLKLRKIAPRRSSSGKGYFQDHDGRPTATHGSNRREEHCAIALRNLERHWALPDGGRFRLLDYQVPLKARRADAGIGKIDLLGVSNAGRLMIIELKVPQSDGGRGDAPPAALMEGLRYAAMVEADLDAFANEAESRFETDIVREPPIVQLLAPDLWWKRWLDVPAAGAWGPPFARLGAEIEAELGLEIQFMAFDDVEIICGADGEAPRLDRVPSLQPLRLE